MKTRRQFALLLSCVAVTLATLILVLPDRRREAPVPVTLAPMHRDSVPPSPAAAHGQFPVQRVEVPSADGVTVDVMVMTMERRPVDSAEVIFWSLRTSDAVVALLNDSVYRAHGLPMDRPMMLSVTASGFATSLREVRASASTTVEVILKPAASIRGKVTLPDGSPPPVQVIVYAAPFTDLPGPWLDLLRATRDGAKGIPYSTTNEQGDFEILGLDPQEDHTVVCGGSGWVGERVHRFIRPGDEGVSLVLWRAYGGVVQLKTAHGQVPDSCFASVSTSAHPFPDSNAITSRSWETIVVQGACAWRYDDDDWRRRLFLVKSATISDQLGSVSLEHEVPGFDASTSAIPMMALSAAALLEATVQLRPWASGFGNVRARFHTAYQLSEVPGELWRAPVMWILRSLDTKLTFERAVGRPSFEPVDAIGVPHGRYEVFLGSPDGAWNADRQPSRLVTVGDEPLEIDYELPNAGSLVVRIDNEGREGADWTSVALGRSDGLGFLVEFASSPYILECIPSGKYRVVVRRQDGTSPRDAVARIESVVINHGEVTECKVSLER